MKPTDATLLHPMVSFNTSINDARSRTLKINGKVCLWHRDLLSYRKYLFERDLFRQLIFFSDGSILCLCEANLKKIVFNEESDLKN
jgi:hypothetical protein